MSNSIIQIENVGKRYTLAHRKASYKTLRESISSKFRGLTSTAKTKFHDIENNSLIEDFWALKNISFEIYRGDRVGIIGRNGAGKSTLLKLLSRITEPTIGRISIKGRIASLLEVGTGFHPELTGRENIFLNGAILGMSREEIHRKFDEIVAFAEVEKFLDTPVKRYSSGMYVRLAFAVAAHLEPEILVVDEVLAVGDVEFQRKCLGKMGELSTKGERTVLFVSHSMAAIEQLCNKAILLEQGEIKKQGSTETVISSYISKYASLEKRSQFDLLEFKRNYPQLYGHEFSGYPLIAAAFILNANDQEIGFVKWNEPFKIRLLVRGNQSSEALNIAITIKDLKGNFVFVSHSTDDQLLVKVGYGTEAEVTCLVDPNILMPGSYTLDIWVGNDSWKWLDFLQEVLIFQIPRVATSLSHIDYRPGNIYLPLKWTNKL
ncbi:MAG: ABC transporter ATP-binding protein [Desertifilum sp. SIO1I2]|nr:ABC transporter ATP-binding protein [Desertifilum sp. SIO1I2]